MRLSKTIVGETTSGKSRDRFRSYKSAASTPSKPPRTQNHSAATTVLPEASSDVFVLGRLPKTTMSGLPKKTIEKKMKQSSLMNNYRQVGKNKVKKLAKKKTQYVTHLHK